MACGMGVAQMAHGAATVVFDSTAQKLFELPNTLTISQIFSRTGRGDRRWLADMTRNGAHGVVRIEPRTLRFNIPSGGDRWVRITAFDASTVRPHAGWIISLLDVTKEHSELELIRQRAEHLHHTVEMNPQIPWCGEADGRLVEVTDRWLKLTGLTREQALGFDAWSLTTHPEDIGMAAAAMTHSMTTGTPLDIRVRVRVVQSGYRWFRATAYPRRDEKGNVIRWYGYTEDIHEHVLVEQKIRWTAEHDALTGLPNRMLFNKRLEGAIEQALQKISRVGLLLLDVDQFKEVNDLLGHDAGDALLRYFSQKLVVALPSSATIARIGGDEFAVLLPEITTQQELVSHCTAIFDALKEPFRFAGRNVDCRTSIGAALYPDHGQRSSELMKHADLALYSAKSSGRGRMMLFEASMHDEMRRRVAMVNRGRAAVEEGSIVPYYQPKVSMSTGKIVGFEALLRLREKRGRVFTPATISAAFEELDVAEAIGEVMLEKVVADMVAWRKEGLAFGHVAINAAPAEFRRSVLADRVIEKLEQAGIPARELQLEVTEGVFLGRGAENAESTIRQLHDYGVNIALDDFGTGFASLSHLRQFPVDTLKIDRSFVSDVAHLSDDAAIVAAIVSLGRNLGIKVVAEGVETPEQAMTLRAQGCEYGQGYLFCRPTPSEEIPALLRGWRSDPQWIEPPRRPRDSAAA